MKHIFLFTYLMVILFALSGCSGLHKNASLRYFPLSKFTPTIQTKRLWSVHASHGATKYYLRLTPAISDQKIFVAGYDGHVVAINAYSGQILWNVNTGINLTSGIGTDAGRLFVATSRGEIIALQQRDGKQLWKATVGSEILATPTATKGTVLVKSLDGSLTALSQNDGEELWRYTQTVPSLILHISSQPKAVGNLVVAGFANGKIAVLNLQNGGVNLVKTITEPKGATVVEQMTDIDVSPIIMNNVIYIATYQGSIVALDLYSGRLIWRHKISSHAGIAADEKYIYLSDAKSYVWAFDRNTGAVVWRQTALMGRMITGPALYSNKYVIVSDAKGYLHWLSKEDGTFIARNHLDWSGVLTPPVEKGGILYIYTRRGYLYAFKKL